MDGVPVPFACESEHACCECWQTEWMAFPGLPAKAGVPAISGRARPHAPLVVRGAARSNSEAAWARKSSAAAPPFGRGACRIIILYAAAASDSEVRHGGRFSAPACGGAGAPRKEYLLRSRRDHNEERTPTHAMHTQTMDAKRQMAVTVSLFSKATSFFRDLSR